MMEDNKIVKIIKLKWKSVHQNLYNIILVQINLLLGKNHPQ